MVENHADQSEPKLAPPAMGKDIFDTTKKELIEQTVKIIIGGLAAIVLAGGAAIWASVSSGAIIHALGGVTIAELPQRITDEVKKLDQRAPPANVESKAAQVPKFFVQRFGASGPAGRSPNEEGYYTEHDKDTYIAKRSEYPICAISSVKAAASGECQLIQSPLDEWRIYVIGAIGCKVTCYLVQ